MSNQELLEKLKEDMELRGFSHYTKDSYYRKAKDVIKYFNKPMEEVTTKELREFLMKYLREKKKVSERSSNYYNSVIRFIYDVVLDIPINHKFGTGYFFENFFNLGPGTFLKKIFHTLDK